MHKERDGVVEHTTWLCNVVKEVITTILEVHIDDEQQLETKVRKISEVIQGFKIKISDLEVGVVPSTPPEERTQRKSSVQDVVEKIRVLEADCA